MCVAPSSYTAWQSGRNVTSMASAMVDPEEEAVGHPVRVHDRGLLHRVQAEAVEALRVHPRLDVGDVLDVLGEERAEVGLPEVREHLPARVRHLTGSEVLDGERLPDARVGVVAL